MGWITPPHIDLPPMRRCAHCYLPMRYDFIWDKWVCVHCNESVTGASLWQRAQNKWWRLVDKLTGMGR